MKRKLFTLFLVFVLLVTMFVSCNEKSKSLIECGEEIVSLMVEMLESEEYKSLYDLSPTYDDLVNRLREGDYSQNIAVYELLVSKEELLDMSIDTNQLSEELYEYICSSAYVSFTSRINQASGVDAMAVSTMFSAQKTFINKDVETSTIYLYVFEDGFPIAVTFIAYGNDTLRVVGHFIMNDEFIVEDEGTIKESCNVLGIKDVVVKKK